jgi:hypothetical protein
MPPKKYLTLAEITSRMRKKPVLVGGSAVDLYTLGGYSSIDLDLIADWKEIGRVLSDMGFRKDGRYYVRRDEFIEVVASDIGGRRVKKIMLDGAESEILAISVEDLIIDRLCACKYWKSGRDCEQARMLYAGYKQKLDKKYLKKMAEKEQVEDKLTEIKKQSQ